MTGAWGSTLAMLLILAAFAGTLWFVHRRFRQAAGGGTLLHVRDSLALGPRERVVIVEAGETWLVLGVAPGRVSALHALPRGQAPASRPASPFAQALKNLGAGGG